jgi:hypothetical protein
MMPGEEEGIPPQEQPVGEDQVPMPAEGEGVDEETGLPVDPETGWLIKDNVLIDKESGDVYDSESRENLGNLFEMQEEGGPEGEEEVGAAPTAQSPEEQQPGIDPEGTAEEGEEAETPPGFTRDPRTGYLVDQQGYMLDEETGNIYGPNGEHLGNLNDQEDEEEEEETN